MVTIAHCTSVDEAQFVKSLLEGSGLTAYIPDEFTSQNLVPLLLSSGVKVQVDDEDAEAARAVLAQNPTAD